MVGIKRILISTLISTLVGWAAMLIATTITTDSDVVYAIGLVAGISMYGKFVGWVK